MKTPDEIKKGLELCISGVYDCCRCSYHEVGNGDCVTDVKCDALAYIQQLEAKVPRWVSVEERLPEKHEGVIVHCNDGFLTLMCYDGRDWQWNGKKDNSVTLWMPLPEPPEVNEK